MVIWHFFLSVGFQKMCATYSLDRTVICRVDDERGSNPRSAVKHFQRKTVKYYTFASCVFSGLWIPTAKLHVRITTGNSWLFFAWFGFPKLLMELFAVSGQLGFLKVTRLTSIYMLDGFFNPFTVRMCNKIYTISFYDSLLTLSLAHIAPLRTSTSLKRQFLFRKHE